ncbi:MAG TPA: glycosyltransferase family 1 protein [Enhygromyxa sp.]|nr:glycosyltransferase family 1 protein [Enhygromyxa sp.]
MRRIAIVVGNYVNVVDGVALTFGRLVRARLLAGDRLLVLAPGAERPRVEPAGAFVPLPAIPIPVQPEYRLALGIPTQTRRLLERFEPELIHIGSPDLAGLAALEFADAHGIPAVASYHSEIARYLRYLPGLAAGLGPLLERGVWRWIRSFYGRCRHVYAPSESMLETLRARGISAELRLWGRGVDTRRFDPSRRSISWRRRLGVADDQPLIGFVARLRWEKGLSTLASVLERLAARGSSFASFVAGDGPARAELERRCPQTIFLGELGVAELARAYASADLFLYPSATETFGNVTLEAMASGLPTICADAPGSRSLVVPGETGELLPPGDVDGFADAVAALLADADRRRAMGQAARARAEGRSWDRAIEQCVAHWDDAIGRVR